MLTDRIERTTTIPAPRERVWALLTEGEHLGRWFGDAGAEIDLRPGGRFTMSWKEHGTAYARVETVEPHDRFAFRWLSFDQTGTVEPAPGNSTLVEFTLADTENGGTKLTVVESGFASLDVPQEEWTSYRDGNVEGWIHETAQLAQYAMDLETFGA